MLMRETGIGRAFDDVGTRTVSLMRLELEVLNTAASKTVRSATRDDADQATR